MSTWKGSVILELSSTEKITIPPIEKNSHENQILMCE